MVSVYIEGRPILFWTFKSYFNYRFIISGPKWYLVFVT